VNRSLFLAALAVFAGYMLGFRDAQVHDKTVVERLLDRAGGSARGKYTPDVDAQMEREAATPAR
jgi:hypothetical protein